MKKYIILSLFIIAAAVLLLVPNPSSKKKIIMIIPQEHEALNQIVAGFKEGLVEAEQYDIEIENAQGNQNLLYSIVQKLYINAPAIDLLVPIGTYVTKMVTGKITDGKIPILGLAALISPEERSKSNLNELVVLGDELGAEAFLEFIHNILPEAKNILLIHSADEKIYKEMDDLDQQASKYNISFKRYLVNSALDIQSLDTAIDGVNAILTLKDHMVASNAAVIKKFADNKGVMFIAADQGSVLNGADVALGVKEKDIGIEGAKIASQLLNGGKPSSIPFQNIKHVKIFVNGEYLSTIDEYAEKANYEIIKIK